LNQWIHRFFLSFPRYVDSAIAGPEEAKDLSGEKYPPPDSDPLNDPEFEKSLANPSREFATLSYETPSGFADIVFTDCC
jgi:hypothetical protein